MCLERRLCKACGAEAVASEGCWIPSEHSCDCEFCKVPEEDWVEDHYCASCAISRGLAVRSRDAARVCGMREEDVVWLCSVGKTKSFEHEGEWWVLKTEIMDDKADVV